MNWLKKIMSITVIQSFNEIDKAVLKIKIILCKKENKEI